MQSAKGRSFARVPVSPPESGGGARSPFQAETGDRDDAGAVDSDQSPTSWAPLWPKRFDGLAYEDRRAKGWHWVGVPIGNAGGNANSQDDGECETLHQSLSSVTKEGRTQPAEWCCADCPANQAPASGLPCIWPERETPSPATIGARRRLFASRPESTPCSRPTWTKSFADAWLQPNPLRRLWEVFPLCSPGKRQKLVSRKSVDFLKKCSFRVLYRFCLFLPEVIRIQAWPRCFQRESVTRD